MDELTAILKEITEYQTPNYRPLATLVFNKHKGELIGSYIKPNSNISQEDVEIMKDVFRKAISEIEKGTGKYWTDMYYMMVSTDRGFYIVEDFEEGFIIVFVMPKGFIKFTVGEKFLKLHQRLIETLKNVVIEAS